MRTAIRGGWTGSISGRSRFPPRTATRQQEPACTSTSSTPASGRSTPSSGAGRTTCMTSSVWPARTVTGTARTWLASSVQRRTGSPRESSCTACAWCSIAPGSGTPPMSSRAWTGWPHITPAPRWRTCHSAPATPIARSPLRSRTCGSPACSSQSRPGTTTPTPARCCPWARAPPSSSRRRREPMQRRRSRTGVAASTPTRRDRTSSRLGCSARP